MLLDTSQARHRLGPLATVAVAVGLAIVLALASWVVLATRTEAPWRGDGVGVGLLVAVLAAALVGGGLGGVAFVAGWRAGSVTLALWASWATAVIALPIGPAMLQLDLSAAAFDYSPWPITDEVPGSGANALIQSMVLPVTSNGSLPGLVVISLAGALPAVLAAAAAGARGAGLLVPALPAPAFAVSVLGGLAAWAMLAIGVLIWAMVLSRLPIVPLGEDPPY